MTIRYEKGYACIESYEFYRFLQEVQEVSDKGYVLDLANNRFPTQYIGYWSAYFNAPGEDVVAALADSEKAAAEAEAEERAKAHAESPASAVNQQSADTADVIPVAVASPDSGEPTSEAEPVKVEEEAPRRRGRPPQNR